MQTSVRAILIGSLLVLAAASNVSAQQAVPAETQELTAVPTETQELTPVPAETQELTPVPAETQELTPVPAETQELTPEQRIDELKRTTPQHPAAQTIRQFAVWRSSE